MNRRKFLSCAVLAATAGATGGAMAMGTASGYNVVGFAALYGPLGEVLVNPYGIAPLTAIIKNGGYELLDADVRVVPKKGGQEIAYKVSRSQLLTHGGVPVFGLYADYQNQVEVTAKKRFKGQVETVKFTYTIYAGPITGIPSGAPHEKSLMFKANVKKVSKKFADRLYFVNNLGTPNAQTMRTIWNNPMGGAMTWQFPPKTVIIDTKGEIRWFLDYRDLWKPEDPYSNGVMMGFHQNPDGCLTFGFGQRYAKYDLMGRKIWNRRLPNAYADFSHALDPAQNGHYFLRVSSADLRRADEKRVHTVRDVIIEVDQNGTVVDEWRSRPAGPRLDEVQPRRHLQDRPEEHDRRAGLGIRQGTRPRLVQPGHVAHPLRSRQGLRHGVLRHGRHGLQPLGRLLDASASCS